MYPIARTSVGLMTLLAGFQVPAQSQIDIPSKLTLEVAKELLFIHNPTLQAEMLTVEAERGDVIAADKRPNPRLTAGSEGINFDSPNRSFFNSQELSLIVRQEFETAGKRRKRTLVEEADVEIASTEFQNAVRLVTFDLKNAYYGVVLAQEDLKLGQEILDGFQGVVGLNRTRYEKGEISGGELRRVEAAQYRFYEDVVAAEVALENAQDRLASLLGSVQFEQGFEAVDDFDPAFDPPPLPELKRTAKLNRTDLLAQTKRVLRADRRIDLEKARSVPNITPFAGYRRDFGRNGAIIGVEIPIVLFNRNQGAIARSLSERRQQERRSRIIEIGVLEETQLALNELRGHRSRIEALQSQYLEKARQSRDIAESSYRLGGASLVEFLDAERTYRETTRLYNRALYDHELSRAKLERAVGKELR